MKPLPMPHPARENPPDGKERALAGIPDKRLRSLVALLRLSPEERAELTAERVRRMASAPLTPGGGNGYGAAYPHAPRRCLEFRGV